LEHETDTNMNLVEDETDTNMNLDELVIDQTISFNYVDEYNDKYRAILVKKQVIKEIRKSGRGWSGIYFENILDEEGDNTFFWISPKSPELEQEIAPLNIGDIVSFFFIKKITSEFLVKIWKEKVNSFTNLSPPKLIESWISKTYHLLSYLMMEPEKEKKNN